MLPDVLMGVSEQGWAGHDCQMARHRGSPLLEDPLSQLCNGRLLQSARSQLSMPIMTRLKIYFADFSFNMECCS